MNGQSFTAFGHSFSMRVEDWKEDLRSLEQEGATYENWILDDELGGPGIYRVRLRPSEIHQFVRAVVAWDEFLDGGFERVSDRQMAERTRANALARYGPTEEEMACPADFLDGELENLLCGGHPERAERIRADRSTVDVVASLHAVADGLPTALKALTSSRGERAKFEITDERDLQDVLYFVVRSVFHSARREEPTPSSAGSFKRADIAVPEAQVLIETKVVRNQNHARKVADELRIDFESYHVHPSCGTVFALVWDPDRLIPDPHQLERDLTSERSKGQHKFDAIVRVV